MEKRSSRIKRSIKRKKIVWIGSAAVLLLSTSLAYAAFQSGEDPSTPPSANAEKPVAEVKEEPTVEKFAEATDEELIDQIHYYNEISLSKEEIQSSHPVAKKIVDQKAKQQNVKPDLDNQRYRDIVKATALDLEGKTPEEQKALVDFAKKVDQYENKETNKRIKELEKKAKKEGLTEKERAELINLLPIKNPGPLLKPEPKKDTEKKPSTPPKEKVKAPAKDEQDGNPQDDNNGNDGQDGKQDGNQQDDSSGEQQDGNQQDDGNGEQQDGNQQDEGNGEQQDGNRQDEGSGEQQDGNQQDGNNDEQQDGNQQNGDSDEQQDGNRQDGNNNDQQDGVSEDQPNQPPLKTEANGYNRAKAVEYAYMWWNKRNNEEYGYYSRSMGGCYACWYDCTNFVSQVIKTGGIKERVGRYDWYDYWFYSDDKPSLTWGLAHSFYKHMKVIRQAQNATLPSQLTVGDIASVDFEGDGNIDHSVVITKIENGQVYATYHSSDSKDKNITDWLYHYNVYAWKMETVKNNY